MSMFTADDITREMGSLAGKFDIRVKDVTGSTNTDVKELAESGAAEFTVVTAGTQTAGRGRLGRSFYSPPDAGLYLSVLLRPELNACDALSLTTCAAVAAAEAIESVCGKPAGIKWVNDIYVSDRKVCGILTESSLDTDGSVRYAVTGIGINVTDNGFPEELLGKAGAIGCEVSVRPLLAAKLLSRFYSLYRSLPSAEYMREYRRRSVLDGRRIEFEFGGSLMSGIVTGTDDSARLLVRLDDGRELALGSGEVNIKTSVAEMNTEKV